LIAKLIAGDGAQHQLYGRSVSLSGGMAAIGAPWDDDLGYRSGSVYILRLRPPGWGEEAKLLASDGESRDEFGRSVSASGRKVLIGAPEDDDNGEDSGAAYVFRYDGSIWIQEAKLLPDDGRPEDLFGSSVALSGDTALIGAFLDRTNGRWSGAAYVFRFDPDESGRWVQEAKLLPDDGTSGDHFGLSVSISGDTAVIGSPCDDDNGSGSGSAYVFGFHPGGPQRWIQEAKLLADDGEFPDHFGRAVSISGETALIGAPFDDDNGRHSGSAYAFRFDGSTWSQEAKLLAEDGAADDFFGYAVSFSRDTAVIGAYQTDEQGYNSGAAYVFRRSGSKWSREAKIVPADGAPTDYFGVSVAVCDDIAMIGARYDDDNGINSGSAYSYVMTCKPGACCIEEVGDCTNDVPPAECLRNGFRFEAGVSCDDLEPPCRPSTCTRDPEWLCDGDVDGDGQVNPVDSALVRAAFGSVAESDLCNFDLDCDGQINPVDSGIVQSLIGTCETPRDSCP